MQRMRRAAIYKLATAAHEIDLDVMNGVLERDNDGRWHVGGHDLIKWLSNHEGEELIVVLGSLADERPMQVQTCRTCGRDYTDIDCPHCRANRIRLRGHA